MFSEGPVFNHCFLFVRLFFLDQREDLTGIFHRRNAEGDGAAGAFSLAVMHSCSSHARGPVSFDHSTL